MHLSTSYYFVLSLIIGLYLRIRYKNNVEIGRNVAFYGRPLFYIGRGAQLKIGDNVVFVSSASVNFVGLTKRSSIAVLSGARLEIGCNSGFSAVSIVCST